jgi:hypothetical protein
MMSAYRLVRLMEAHAEALATSLLDRVTASERCTAYRRVPEDDLRYYVGQVYQRLGEWLLGKSEFDIEKHYRELGKLRARQGVPVSQLMWVIAVMKENLMEFLQREAPLDTPGELLGELRVLQLMEQFFDRASYYAALGHEEAAARQAQEQQSALRGAAAGSN